MNRTRITVLIVLLIGIALLTTYIYMTGEFKMLSSTGMKRDSFIPGEVYYFGHEMKWDGVVRPNIKAISIVRKDGTKVIDNEQGLAITPFIDYSRHTGVLSEKDYQEMVSRNELDYEAVSGNEIRNDEFTLVFKVKANDLYRDYETNGIIINYRVIGIPKKQFFEYKGFLSD
jgi:hypothetical protein